MCLKILVSENTFDMSFTSTQSLLPSMHFYACYLYYINQRLRPLLLAAKPAIGGLYPSNSENNMLLNLKIRSEIIVVTIISSIFHRKIEDFCKNVSQVPAKIGFSRSFGKTRSQIRIFFCLKPSHDQDGANKKSLAKLVQLLRSY